MKEQIVEGHFEPGSYLPPESELCALYGMGRNSVRKSLQELEKDGWVVKRNGLGTQVNTPLLPADREQAVLKIVAPYPAYYLEYGLPYILESFARIVPDVEVKILYVPIAKFWRSFHSNAEMGGQADLLFVSDQHIPVMEKLEAFVDLGHMPGSLDYRLHPKLLHPFTIGKSVKAIPVTYTPTCLAYNPLLFAKGKWDPPSRSWTLNDFTQACESLTLLRGGMPAQFGVSFYTALSRWLPLALRKADSGRIGISKDSLQEALEIIRSLLFKDRSAVLYEPYGPNPFVYGKSAMTLTTAFEMANWQDASLGFKPMLAPLPFGSGSTILQANAWMIPAACSNRPLAETFIRVALSSDAQENIARHTPLLTVFPELNSRVKKPEHIEAYQAGEEQMDRHLFLDELFHVLITARKPNPELDLFWMGLSSPASVIRNMTWRLRS